MGKPLMSVGQICDRGFKVVFSSKQASVVSEKTGKVACTFERDNGLYVAAFGASPAAQTATFARQG